MLRKFLFSAMGLVCLFQLKAQDSAKVAAPAPATTFTGSVDVFYRYNFGDPKAPVTNNATSFTNSHNSFELGMASVKLVHSFGKVSGVIDLGFGQRAKEFSYNESGITQSVKQAYVTYAPSDKITFTMGKFATHVGYELVDPQLNRNYSMSYMFSYGPFSHTGLKADITVSKNFGFMLGVANPTDFLSAPFTKKFFIGQLHAATTSGSFVAYLNYVGGKDTSKTVQNQFDLVATVKVSSMFSIGANGTVKFVKPDGGSNDKWWGAALYLNVDPAPKFGFTVRGEIFDDKKNVTGVLGSNQLFEGTLTLNIKPSAGLMIMPEFRFDSANDNPLFVKHDGSTTKSTGAFILAAIYSF
jgi:Putative beta-barrel porin-2, OmpL-like. bbp2